MTKKVRRTNVKDGILAPLGNGFALAIGKNPNKTDDIDIGPNNKNGLSVNHGEILQNTGNTLRVFSAEPMFNGISPAQLLYGGMNPNAVFALQEQYKQTHRIADDGSHYEVGGNKKPPLKKIYNTSAQRDSAQVNIFKPGPNNKIQSNRIAHRKSLEAFVKRNPTLYGLNTADFVDFLLDNATMESENLATQKHGNMYGYYQLRGLNPNSTEEQQHMAAYKHLSNLFTNVLTDADIAEAKKHGMSVQGFASKVLANKGNYSSAMVKKANFAKNASKWKHLYGGEESLINPLGERPNANNKQNMNNYLMGGPRKKISSTTPLEDMRKRFTKEQQNRTRFGREGSGGFGGSGASGHWDDSLELIDSVQYVRNTPILGEQTFSQAYNIARKAGLNKFVFNGKEYTTEYNPNAIIGKKQTEIAPILNLREVLDKNEKPITDSTRFEPYVGQIPGKHKRVVNKKVYGGNMNNRKKALSGTQLGLLSAGMNTLGAGIGSLIQQNAINRLRYTPRVSKIYDPVKLKTKINIAPQLAEINNTVSKITDLADRTSASSRDRFAKVNSARLYGNSATSRLLGEQENKETELINADRMNQQGMRNKTIDSVIDTLNTNIAGKDQLNNLKRISTSNNWTTALNTITGAWGGPNGFFDREAARNVKAGELLTQSIANPTAAKLLFGDIDFTTEENRNAAFKLIYDWLNNNRLG